MRTATLTNNCLTSMGVVQAASLRDSVRWQSVSCKVKGMGQCPAVLGISGVDLTVIGVGACHGRVAVRALRRRSHGSAVSRSSPSARFPAEGSGQGWYWPW